MTNPQKLILIKIAHTAIWVFFNVVIFYMLYAVLTDKIDFWLWLGYGIILLEGMVLLAFKMYCPLTVWARKYSDSTKDNFDIYLPNWLAKHNKTKPFAHPSWYLLYCLLSFDWYFNSL